MPTPLKGSVRLRGEKWIARLTVARGRKVTIHLVTCRPHEDEKARARTTLLCDLAKRLRGAGLAHLADGFLERAAGRDGPALEDVCQAVDRLASGEAAPPINAATTLQEFGQQWTEGKLHERWPDHVKKKKSAIDDAERLARYVYPLVGSVPLPEFSITHADLVMSSLPPKLSPASRRHVAQALARLIKLAAYPARIIHASPLPPGFLPPLGKRKAFSFLYPDEDRQLLGCTAIPLAARMHYGVLAREGMRRSEAASLTWGDVDLERGAVTLDENKTDDPRAWALDPGVTRALRAWRALRGNPAATKRIFVDEAGTPLSDEGDGKACLRLRAHLKLAGVTRAELFERTKVRSPLRMHDMRATFITISLANGRTETWVADRTGHTSSVMINRYRRAARRAAELGLGELSPLDQAVPELRPPPEPEPEKSPESGPDDRGTDRPNSDGGEVAEGSPEDQNPIRSGEIAEAGLEPAHPCGQRILNPSHGPCSPQLSQDHGAFQEPIATDRDDRIPIGPLSALINGTSGGTPRAALARVLGALAGELAAAGDLHAARVAHEALGRLLGAPAEAQDGADVHDLSERRRRS